MCGIGGLVSHVAIARELLDALDQAQAHRGPDGRGRSITTVGPWSVGLTHQRLAVIDLSPAGLQPITESGGAGSIIFNGEIYNYIELRRWLHAEGAVFATGTDTEVLLTALRRWGVERTLQRAVGMWAFAWLDCSGNRLVLARDRFGKKPLHFTIDRSGLAFASELKGIFALRPRSYKVNVEAVAPFLAQAILDHSDATFVEGVEQVPAGSYVTVNLAGDELHALATRYYQIPRDVEVDQRPLQTVASELRARVAEAVRVRLRSDVPVGVLTSGGIDSSAIAALAHAARGDKPLTLLTAVSDDPSVDERAFVALLNQRLGERSVLVRFDPNPTDAWRLLTLATWHNDAPVGSFSNVLQLELMRMARDLGITVLLSGQGADEAASGYTKFLGFHLHGLIRDGRLLAAATTAAGFAGPGGVLSKARLTDAKRYLPSRLGAAVPSVLGERLADVRRVEVGMPAGMSLRERQVRDIEHLSVPVLTRYEDRMGMAMSREIRNPFLDHRVVELLLQLPPSYRIGRGFMKLALREAMSNDLPREIAWRRPKNGFELPEATWMRGPLKSVVDDFISPGSRMVTLGLVDLRGALAVKKLFMDGGKGRRLVGSRDVFSLCALELWLRAHERVVA